MSKEIICVFQDCILCGDRGKALKKLIFSKNLNVRNVSFASDEGKELICHAVTEHGIKSMPFFTDGEKFATTLEALLTVEEPVKKPRKSVKKTKKGAKK